MVVWPSHTEKLHSSVYAMSGGETLFDFLSFGVSSRRRVLSRIKVNLQLMAGRLAHLSQTCRFDTFDTDGVYVCVFVSVCVCARVRVYPGGPRVCHVTGRVQLRGPQQFEQVAHHNARSAKLCTLTRNDRTFQCKRPKVNTVLHRKLKDT